MKDPLIFTVQGARGRNFGVQPPVQRPTARSIARAGTDSTLHEYGEDNIAVPRDSAAGPLSRRNTRGAQRFTLSTRLRPLSRRIFTKTTKQPSINSQNRSLHATNTLVDVQSAKRRYCSCSPLAQPTTSPPFDVVDTSISTIHFINQGPASPSSSSARGFRSLRASSRKPRGTRRRPRTRAGKGCLASYCTRMGR
jgi:hypothetical protein